MARMLPLQQALACVLSDFARFSEAVYPAAPLRRYQLEAAAPILAAVDARRRGHAPGDDGPGSFVVQFSRQAGKDELLARLQAYLLARYQLDGGSIVLAAPTYRPQAQISRRRLMARLATPLHLPLKRQDDHGLRVGAATATFLSAGPHAHARGETAGLLLIANEAQDMDPDRWDSVFAPMTASTAAPSVFAGTPWAAGSLLSRETAHAAGAGTLYQADWQRVAAELPAYGTHVRGRIAQLGPNHPFIQTEYGLQELDAAGGFLPAARQAQMHGSHARQAAATPGHTYALLLDVAGGDADGDGRLAPSARERRDSTALTVVDVDLTTVQDDLLRRPTYRVVDRRVWTGTPHHALLPQLLDLGRTVWRARYLVIDATGLGAGLASLLQAALAPGCRVLPFVFSAGTKSDLGWAFLGVLESGRFKDYADDGAADTRLYWAQVAACTYTVAPGPGRLLRWSVPPAKGHDDLLVSAALVGALDTHDWRPRAASARPLPFET
ncbi:MAG TPA: hypothetical protein VM536_08165 [Chloroflexia bacterium]|nr:hypothetical protein [Chloroflexia bacterium]